MANGNETAWKKAGDQLRRRRIELGYGDRQKFVDAHGLKYRIINDLENGNRGNYEPDTLIAAEVAYRLGSGSLRRALEGGELEAPAAPDVMGNWRGAPPAAALSDTGTATDFLTTVQDPEAEREQSRAIVDAMIRVPRAEIVAHVGEVAKRRGIVIAGPNDLGKLNELDGQDLYPGDAGLNPVLAAIWEIKDAPVSDRFDMMSIAVLKHPAGGDKNLRSALPAKIPGPRSPSQPKPRNVLH